MNMTSPAANAQRPAFNPMMVIAAGCLIAVIGNGIRSSMGLFNDPLTDMRGWSQETFGLAMALQNLVWGFMAPVAGILADKLGSMRVIMAGAILYAAGLVIMAYADTTSLFHLGSGVVMGIGVSLSAFPIVMAAFGRMVPADKRSWAFGIATAASSFGQFIFAPLGQAFIAAYGWQTALVIVAGFTASMLLIAMPLRADTDMKAAAATEPDMTIGQSLKQAFGHGSYLLLTFGFFVCGFHVAFITVFLPKYVVDLGVTANIAAWSIGVVGLFNIAGSYMAGVWGGRHSKRIALSLIYLGRAIVIFGFLMLPVTNASTLVFCALMGLLWLSTIPLTMGLVTVMFGTRYMATLYGFVFLSHQVGAFLGVWLGGKLFDIYGTYDPVWWLSIALGVFAALVHWPIKERAAPAMEPARSG